MRHASTPGSRVALLALVPAVSESRLAGLWCKFMHDLLDPYRPELHYMRGPGPGGARSTEIPSPVNGIGSAKPR